MAIMLPDRGTSNKIEFARMMERGKLDVLGKAVLPRRARRNRLVPVPIARNRRVTAAP
jgi:hypothetical protein